MENSLIESVKALLHNAGLMRQVTENPNSLLAEHYNRICSLLEEKPPLHVVEPPSSPTATAEPEDKEQTAEKILDRYVSFGDRRAGGRYKNIIAAMTEFASLKEQEARRQAIQECQDKARHLRSEVNEDTTSGSVMWGKGKMKALAELIHELEKLK